MTISFFLVIFCLAGSFRLRNVLCVAELGFFSQNMYFIMLDEIRIQVIVKGRRGRDNKGGS